MDRNLIFQHILTKFFLKKCSKNSLQYLENDPLNVLTLVVTEFWIELIFKKISNYSAHMHNFNISGLQIIKVTFFILLFLFVPAFLSLLCLPFVSPRCVSPGR